MLADDPVEAPGNLLERGVPAHLPATNVGVQQSAIESDGLGERRAFRAQASEIGRMARVATDFDDAGCCPRQQTASHTTVRAGCSDGRRVHQTVATVACAAAGGESLARAVGPNNSLSLTAETSRP